MAGKSGHKAAGGGSGSSGNVVPLRPAGGNGAGDDAGIQGAGIQGAGEWGRVRAEAGSLPLHQRNARPERSRTFAGDAIHPLGCRCLDCRERRDPMSVRRRDAAALGWGIAAALIAVALLLWLV